MADAKLGMSLDDIITKNRSQTSDGPSKKAQGARREERSQRPQLKPGKDALRAQGGAIRKPTAVPGRARNTAPLVAQTRGFAASRRAPVAPRRAAVHIQEIVEVDDPSGIDGKWQHDKFHELPYAPVQRAAPMNSAAKLIIKNLDYNVSTDDIKELFSNCGLLLKYGVDYDNSGRSLGTASVVFKNSADAQKAVQRYNNVALDGKKMIIELAPQGQNPNVIKRLSSGISVTTLPEASGRRTGLQLTRNFAQATRSIDSRPSRVGGRPNRLSSRVVVNGDGMEE